MDAADRAVQPEASAAAPDQDVTFAGLRAELEGAAELGLDERLALLRRAEATIAGALEGLDGL